MSLEGVYDDSNIFMRILRGEVPAARIVEDAETLAFMDAFPQSRGHALVIHKHAQARNLLDIEPAALAAVMETVRRVARASRSALRPDGLVITQFNGTAAGQTVFHLHVHIIPRWEGVPMGRHGAGGMADPAELRTLAEEIAAHLEG
jgi:histidine triad (HIT) family protein